MRRMMGVLSAVAILAITISAQGSFNLRIAAANGKAAAKLPVVMSKAENAPPIGMTGADGDIDIASDPNKNGKTFNVYRLDCNRIVLLEEGSQDDQSCKKQSAQSPPSQNGCGSCVPMGVFVWGRSTVIGHFASSGSAWKNPWAITSLVGVGIAAPVIITQTGGSSPAPTAVAGPAPNQPAAPAPAPVPAPAPPPAPVPTFPNITNRNITYTATPASADTCGTFIQATFSGTGHISVDPSGPYGADFTDATNTTLVFAGRGTANGATSFSLGASQPFNYTSATSQRNYQAVMRVGTISSTGSGSVTVEVTYVSGGQAPNPPANCTNSRAYQVIGVAQ